MHNKLAFLFLFIGFCDTIVAQSKSPVETNKSEPINIGRSVVIRSAILSEKRTINICLPAEYSNDSTSTYPVIYLLDGGIDEDFIHIAGLVRYNNTPWVNRFPGSIVVGIENTNRKRDFTFATPDLDFLGKVGFDKNSFPSYGGSANFIAFIEKELQPFIQHTLKTNGSRTIIGESLGGLLATEILLSKPDLFDTYVIISPSLWWGAEKLLHTTIPTRSFSNSRKIYIAASNEAEDTLMFSEAKRLATLLKRSALPGDKIVFDHMQHESHATIIHQAVYNAFKKLYSTSDE